MQRFRARKAADLFAGKAIRSFNGGDIHSFEFIYRSYCEFVYRICLRMLRDPIEAEDATQDVFVCVYRKINTFRGESAFSTWLYRLTTNSVLMRFRKNKHKNAWISLEDHREEEAASCSKIDVRNMKLSGLLDRIALQTAIDVLPDGYRTAFVLHEIQGYDHHEIARMFGHSVGNSKSQLHKARVRLRKLLSGAPQKRVPQDTMTPTGPN